MKQQVKSLYQLGSKPFGALLTDESSMPETGEEISKTMNLARQGIVDKDAKKVFYARVVLNFRCELIEKRAKDVADLRPSLLLKRPKVIASQVRVARISCLSILCYSLAPSAPAKAC